MKTKILLVEDDLNLGNVLQDYLELQEYEVDRALDGNEGYESFMNSNFDLIILDIMMPLKDGFTLAKEIREVNEQVPIIFLTARGQLEDRVTGFKTGCDDYITKPFNSEELAMRIEAIMRRCRMNGKNGMNDVTNRGGIYHIGKYTFDVSNSELRLENQRISLTPKEVALLSFLYFNKNQLITREKTQTAVWGDNNYFIGRSMDVFITKLRKYLKDDPNVAIVNIHSTGFRLEIKE